MGLYMHELLRLLVGDTDFAHNLMEVSVPSRRVQER